MGKPEALEKLEAIIHPLVRAEENRFRDGARVSGAKLIVLDIPLLFETGAEDRVDKILVVTAPEEVQRKRVLERPGMTPDKLGRDSGTPDSGCGKARPRRFHHRHAP